MRVLDFGSLNYDYVYQVEHFVQAGETLASESMAVHIGGKGLNQAMALKRAGVPVFMAGAIGEDGQGFIDSCAEADMSSEFIQRLDGKCGHAIIQVDRGGQNCILLYGGTNLRQSREWIDHVIDSFSEGDYILLQNEISEMSYIIDRAYDRGMKIILNPSPINERILSCDLNKISLFIMNEIEGALISGREEFEDILEGMRALYPKAEVVLTCGSKGSYYQNSSLRHYQEIFRVNTVDTTAAGDTFTGYFIAGLTEGRDIADCMRRAAKAASIAVSREGAVPSIPYADEIENEGVFKS